jgi:hypothetical protein
MFDDWLRHISTCHYSAISGIMKDIYMLHSPLFSLVSKTLRIIFIITILSEISTLLGEAIWCVHITKRESKKVINREVMYVSLIVLNISKCIFRSNHQFVQLKNMKSFNFNYIQIKLWETKTEHLSQLLDLIWLVNIKPCTL